MRKIFLITIISVLIVGCSDELPYAKYKSGDVVYLKPDSIKAVVNGVIELKDKKNPPYTVTYMDKDGNRIDDFVNEKEIY